MVNCLLGFGNGWLIPRGSLREPLFNLKRARIIILNYFSREYIGLIEQIKKYNNSADIFTAKYIPAGFCGIDGRDYALGFLKGKNVLCVSAIACPQGFWRVLEDAGISIKDRISFVDHREFSAQDIAEIKTAVKQGSIEAVVITRKDKVRFLNVDIGAEVFILDVRLAVENEEGFKQKVYGLLFGGNSK